MNIHRTAMAAALACAAAGSHAHDTWFEPLPASESGRRLALGTGTQYPRQDSGIGREFLVRQGCHVDGSARRLALQAMSDAPGALILVAPPQARTCWAQLTPFEVELPAAKVATYFKDIQPPAAVREAWAEMQGRGVTWHERYTKHARIDLGPAGAEAPGAAEMGMNIRIETAAGALTPGATLVAQVLRDGQPLPDQAIELRSESSPIGLWRRTDAQGRLSVPVPLPGRWILRGTDLRLSASAPDQWESRFVTLAFEVPANGANSAASPGTSSLTSPAPPSAVQNGSHLTLNALSINHTPATTAITSEPPVSTARR
jgi:hypothetical protein